MHASANGLSSLDCETKIPAAAAPAPQEHFGRHRGLRLRTAIAWFALAVVAGTGCAARSGWSNRNDRWASAGGSPDPLVSAPPVVEPGVATETPAATAPAEPRAGSNRLATTAPPTGNGAVSETETLVAALAELQSLGAISPQDQAQLLEDLKATDPQLWPQLIQYAKAARARQQTAAGAVASIADSGMNPSLPATAPSGVTTSGTRATDTAGQRLPAAAVAMAPNPAAAPGGMAASPSAEPIAVTPPSSTVGSSPVVPAVATLPASGAPAPVVPVNHMTAMPAAGAGNSADWQAQLSEAIRLHEAAQTSGGVAPNEADLIRLRMLYLAAGRRDDALRTLDTLPAAQQAFWSNTLFALSTYLDEQSTPDLGQRATQALSLLHSAEAQLASLGTLGVKNLAFCTEVKSFGITKPFDRYEFAPGQEVLLYAELENFHSEETPEGFHTAFRSSYEVFDSQGRTVDKHEFALTEEQCKNRRRDFFIRYYLQLPREQLYDGKHTLRLTIEDTLGHKVGQASLDFTVKKSAG